jgi:hypothetical protein
VEIRRKILRTWDILGYQYDSVDICRFPSPYEELMILVKSSSSGSSSGSSSRALVVPVPVVVVVVGP